MRIGVVRGYAKKRVHKPAERQEPLYGITGKFGPMGFEASTGHIRKIGNAFFDYVGNRIYAFFE
jgi:hypothetical protein